MKRTLFILVSAVLFFGFQAAAQWVSDPMENTPVSNAAGEQNIPKIAVCEDGHMYMSWFSMEEGNYNVRMQYLDANGNALWEENGILVSDEPQMTWLTDYDLTVDPAGNAIVTFQDIRTGDNNPVAYCVSPAGELLWGEEGVMLANTSNFDVIPVVCTTGEGNAVFAWQSEATAGNEVHLQKISPAGDPLWGDGIILSSSSENYTYPFLKPAGGDQVYLIWHKESGPFWAPNRGLYVQLLDSEGNFVWETDAEIYSPVPSGPVVSLDIKSDGMGGLIFAWYRNDTGLHFHAYVQHMDSEGNVTMEAGGALVSTTTQRNHMYPAAAWLELTQEIVVFFSEQDLNQIQRGLYAQKFDLEGNRQWTDEGKMLIPLSDNDYSLIMASGFFNQAISVYQAYEFGNASDSKIQAVMLDGDGNYVWGDQFIDMSTNQSSKVHPELTGYFWGQWVCAWEDDRNGTSDIYAQNIQPDGTLGPVVTAVENPSEQLSGVFPNPCLDKLTIELNIPDALPEKISICDITGREIQCRLTMTGQRIIIRTNHLNPGMYFYRLETSEEQIRGNFMKK